MTYSKDKSIVAQSSANAAGVVTAAIIAANPDHETTFESAMSLFDRVAEHIYERSMRLGGDPADRAQVGNDPGGYVVKVGKHREGKWAAGEMTIREIHALDPSYVTWLTTGSRNPDAKAAAQAFLKG